MAKGLQFDETLRKAMEMAYLTPDIAAARAEVVKKLDIQAGETILDIGSGPGFLAKDLANCVGPTGYVHGVDLAEKMIETSKKLCTDQPWTEFQVGPVVFKRIDYE